MDETGLVGHFEAEHGNYADLCERLELLLHQLLRERHIRIHSITSRVKDRDSLIKKLQRKRAPCTHLSDITDLAGLRIITYFADQVDEIARVIEEEFRVDRHDSVDKRAVLDPDRFGYLSLHYVVSLSAQRAGLTEYRALAALKAEIQIRSILQHAWAEIEHDLGYKTNTEVPRPVRRDFARLAGLLELADSEFVRIRGALEEYSREIGSRIASQPAAVTLDRISLIDFVRRDPLVERLDHAIAEQFQYSIRRNEDSVAGDVDKLLFFGLQTVADVRRELERHASNIERLAQRWAREEDEPDSGGSLPEGICLFYLCHVLAGASQLFALALEYTERFRISGIDQSEEEIARELVDFMADQSRESEGG